MLVATKYKRVLLYPPDPKMITTVIPTATIIEQGGKQAVAVPHRIDEVRVLNNLGFKVPSPISFYHEWRAPFDAFEAQKITAGMLTLNPRAYVLNELGTGKTQATLWAADYLMKVGLIRRVLICCTLSTIERVWGDEIFSSFRHRTAVSLHSHSAARRLKLLDQPADFYIINHDGLKVTGVLDALIKRLDIDLVVIDELAVFRNSRKDMYLAMDGLLTGKVHRKTANGKRTRIVQIGPPKVWAWGLTAKPTPTAPTDAWAQCKLITPGTVPPYFKHFRDETMFQPGPYKWESKPYAADAVARVMRPSVRFKRSQCYDAKEPQYETRHAQMSVEQQKVYDELKRDLITQYEAGEIKAFNQAVKLAKLVQISSGVVYSTTHDEIQIPCGERLQVLDELCEEATNKVIIFAPFVCTVKMIASDRRARGKRVGVVYGNVSKHERDKIFLAFQHGDLDELIAQPAAMAHGLTLTAADMIIWFAPVDNGEIYEQANGRITRPSQAETPIFAHIEGCQADRIIYRRLKRKQDFQNVVLELLQTEHELVG